LRVSSSVITLPYDIRRGGAAATLRSMLAIRARQVFDGTRVVPGAGTVFVDGGRIAGVEPTGVDVPADCPVLDRPQATVLPGLIDAHVHLLADSGPGALDRLADYSAEHCDRVIAQTLRVTLNSGVTTVRDLGDRDYAVLDWRQRHTGGATPTIVAAGPPIPTPRGHCWNMGGEAAGPDALRAAVRERAARGVDVIKVMASGGVTTAGTDIAEAQYGVDDLSVIVAEAHDLGLPVTAHAHPLTAIRDAIAAGVDGIEHCTFVTADGLSFAPDVVALLAERQIVVCPTLGNAAGVVPPPPLRDLLDRSGLTVQTRNERIAALRDAGVRLVSGTDGGINPGKPHGVLPNGIAQLVQGGMAPAAALASATSLAAEACGLGDRKGRVRPGYDADLLLVDGDPLVDIDALTRVDTVILNGVVAAPAPAG
jgi:imidazolonepropionase-like amidohydrolase